jgi:Sap, sulfolipid-1-addressing protein
MLSEAAGLAVLTALSPAALLVVAVFLGSATPRRTGILYLAGAITMTAVMATVVFIALRAGHLYTPHQHKTRYGLRLGLGVLLLAAGLYVRRRGPRARDPVKEQQGLIARMTATPGPKAAFIVGILVYSPSLTFVAAVQIVATSKASVAYSVLALIVVIAITVLCVWLPLVLYLLMPERTGHLLTSFSGWLRGHGQLLLVGALIAGGVLLTLNGILGLTGAL